MLKIKSKIFTGLMVALFVVSAIVSSNPKIVSAETWAPTSATMINRGSSSVNVKWLQATLNAVQNAGLVVDGKYGAKTTAAIRVFQAAHPTTGAVDGVAGKKTIAALNVAGAALGGSMSTVPGCTSTSGFSPTTGAPCNSGTVVTPGLPAGCTSASGFSPVTGASCATGSLPQTGAVTAMLSTDNPATGTIVAGQATADLMHVTFTGSGTVNSVTLQRGGVSDQNTLANVYLYDGVTRLTDGYSFNSNGSITINNLNLAVNGSKTISVKADVASTSSYDIFVTLTSFSAGTSVNTVSIKGNDMFIASGANLATIAKDSTGSAIGATGGNTVATASVNAGTTSYTVWRQAVQVNTRTLWLKAANFRITGSAPADALTNVGLYVDGVKVGNNAMMTMTNGSNYLSFDASAAPVQLTTGTHSVEVRADIVKGSSYNFSVSLQQASDLMVMDPQVGVNVALYGTLGLGSFTASQAGIITIGTGSFTAVTDPTFSSMTNVTAGASNVAIAKFKIHGYGEDVKVTSVVVTPVFTGSTTPAQAGGCPSSGSANGLQNVSLYYNGSQVGSQQAWCSGALTFNLGSQMIVAAGADSTLEVRADLRNLAGSNYTAGQVSANITSTVGEGWSSHTAATSLSATGNVLTMQSGVLGISKNAGYSNQNANPNTAGVKIGSYILQNQSTSESVRVTTLSVATTYGAGTSSANLAGLRTSETSGNAGTPVQPATAAASGTGVNTFSVDFTIAPGATKTIDILADSNSDAGSTATVATTLTVTSIGAVSNVSATSSAIPGQTIAFRTGTFGTPTIVTSNSTVAQLVAAANGGATDGSLAVYNLTSSNAGATVTELTFTVTSGTATSVRVGSVSAPVVGTTAYLTGLNIPVPNGGSGTNISVYVSYPEVGTNGVASTTASTLTLTTIKSTSGNTTTTSTVSVAAPSMTLVGSKPGFAVTDSTDTLLNGLVKLAEVTVSADTKGDIKLGQLAILVNSTGVAAIASGSDNILVKDTSGSTIATTNATFAVAAGGSGTGIICFDTAVAACGSGQAVSNGYLIPAGTSKTFRIYATASSVAGAVNTTSLSTKLGAASSTKFYDVAGGNSTAVAATLLYGYPTDTSVISN